MIPLTSQDQFYTIRNLQRSPISQTSNWSWTFFCCLLQQTGSSFHNLPVEKYRTTSCCYFFLICSTVSIPLSPDKQVIGKRKIFFTGNLENCTNKILFAHSKGYFREFSSFLQCTNLLLVKVSYLNKFKLFYQIYIRLSKVYIE